MKHRSVVASFFFFPSPSTSAPLRVALFRRSYHPNIRSYQGKLAPISGSIDFSTDSSPIGAATREIREETQLVANRDLRLDFTGPPFSFVDEEAGRSWTVYPFGWTLLCDEGKLKLDWEHDGWKWVDVGDVLGAEPTGEKGQEEYVPRVEESLRRIYCGMGGMFGIDEDMVPGSKSGNAFRIGMESLRSDLENGARMLALEAVKCLRAIVNGFRFQGNEADDMRCWRSLRIAGYHLTYSARPSMNAAIGSAVVDALTHIHGLFKKDEIRKEEILDKMDEIISVRAATAQRLSECFTEYLLSSTAIDISTISIITLSSSSTVRAALVHLIASISTLDRIATINISILESRPRCEGASFAASLIRALNDLPPLTTRQCAQVVINVAPDSHLLYLLNQVKGSAGAKQKQYLLIGADRISSEGDVLNKTLSLSAAVLVNALAPTTHETETMVVSEIEKIECCCPESQNTGTRTIRSTGEIEKTGNDETEHGAVEDVIGLWEAAGVKSEDVEILRDALIIQDEAAAADPKAVRLRINIKNVVFEWVPSIFIDTYLTEDGPMAREEIQRRSNMKIELERKIFGRLYDE